MVKFLLFGFEGNGRQLAVRRLLSSRVVEHLIILKHFLRCSFWGRVSAAADAFPLEERAFSDDQAV